MEMGRLLPFLQIQTKQKAMNPIPPDIESFDKQCDRHASHQFLMEEQKQSKVAARERHKLNHGRAFRYPGHLY